MDVGITRCGSGFISTVLLEYRKCEEFGVILIIEGLDRVYPGSSPVDSSALAYHWFILQVSHPHIYPY